MGVQQEAGAVLAGVWPVLESAGKDGVAVRHFNMPEKLTSHWRRQIVRISLALLPLHFWSVVAELSPLHLMDDVLGQLVIMLNLLLIAVLMWPMCRDSWRDKESHNLRLVTVTVLAIIPLALMVLTATGYFYTTLRLSGRWIETVYLVIVWNLLFQTVLRGLSVAARRIAYRRAVARRQHQVKEGLKGQSRRKSRLSPGAGQPANDAYYHAGDDRPVCGDVLGHLV